MIPPGLRVREIVAGNRLIHIEVESPTSGVAILDITIGAESTPAPLHWRAGDWTKPPLDVSLARDGRPEQVQVVLQDEDVRLTDSPRLIEDEAGLPSFEVDDWPSDRYLDTRTALRAERLRSGELEISIRDTCPVRRLRLGVGLDFGIDAAGFLVELVIGPLDDEQWRKIEASSP